jgi:hypothetical protein
VKSATGRYNAGKNIGQCKIEVYGPNEGNVPHFHISNNDNSFRCCVRIYENYYFPHGGDYAGRLNSKQCKILNRWLSSQNINMNKCGLTNWQWITNAWENSNPNCEYKNKTDIQPRYDQMEMFRDENITKSVKGM